MNSFLKTFFSRDDSKDILDYQERLSHILSSFFLRIRETKTISADSDDDEWTPYSGKRAAKVWKRSRSRSKKFISKVFADQPNSQQAILTLPEFLSIGRSSVHKSEYGIWSKIEIAEGTRFGPYEGAITYKSKEECESGYLWQLSGRRKNIRFVDAKDESHSNWLRFVNYARYEVEQNLVAFPYERQIYYFAIKTIPPQTELLVWYSEEYADEVGFGKQNTDGDVVEDEDSDEDERYQVMANNSQLFPCNICKKNFNNTDNLNVHLQVHKEKKLFVCKLCKKKFLFKTNLVKHLQKHVAKKFFACKLCNKKFTFWEGLRRHQLIHPKVFDCKVCKKKFAFKNNFLKHQLVHTADKSSADKTSDEFELNNNVRINQHQLVDTVEKSSADKAHDMIELNNNISSKKPFGCDICEKTFSSSGILNRHQKVIHKNFVCNICDQKFVSTSSLKLHNRLHTGEETFICNICEKAFTCSKNLKIHNRKAHKVEKPFTCKTCNVSFKYAVSLEVHTNLHKFENLYT